MKGKWLGFVTMVAVLLLCGGRNASAQNEETQRNTLYVALIRGNQSPAPFNDFIDALRTELSQSGVDLQMTTNLNWQPAEDVANITLEGHESSNSDGSSVETIDVSERGYELYITFRHRSPVLDSSYWRGFFQIRLPADDISLQIIAGISLYAINRCDLAVPYFTSVAGEAQNDFFAEAALFYHGNCALLDEDYPVAADLFTASIVLNRTYPVSAVTNLAWTYLQLGREDEAFALMDGLVAEMNSSFEYVRALVLARRAQIYVLAFRYDDAIADMDAAIELAPDDPELYVLRGNITLLIYEWDSVLADYNYAIEISPNNADAYFYRGVFYYTRTEYDLALNDLNHYLELAPDGEHAADSTTYIEEIERTQAALDG